MDRIFPTLRLAAHDTTLIVHLDNPATHLLTGQAFSDLDHLGRRLRRDPRFRAVILTGPRPGVFAPHYDLAEIVTGAEQLGLPTPYPLARVALSAVAAAVKVPGAEALLTRTPAAGLIEMLTTHRALARLGRLPQVVIAAINGDALGGGCEVALACDIRIMADGDFVIGLPEVSAGIPPGAGGSVRMVRTIGSARATAMMLRARPLDPSGARDVGLVDEVVAPEALMSRAQQIADRVATWNPAAVSNLKRTVAAAAGSTNDFRVEAAGFVTTASGAAAIAKLKEFGDASTATTSPWRDRGWLEV